MLQNPKEVAVKKGQVSLPDQRDRFSKSICHFLQNFENFPSFVVMLLNSRDSQSFEQVIDFSLTQDRFQNQISFLTQIMLQNPKTVVVKKGQVSLSDQRNRFSKSICHFLENFENFSSFVVMFLNSSVSQSFGQVIDFFLARDRFQNQGCFPVQIMLQNPKEVAVKKGRVSLHRPKRTFHQKHVSHSGKHWKFRFICHHAPQLDRFTIVWASYWLLSHPELITKSNEFSCAKNASEPKGNCSQKGLSVASRTKETISPEASGNFWKFFFMCHHASQL